MDSPGRPGGFDGLWSEYDADQGELIIDRSMRRRPNPRHTHTTPTLDQDILHLVPDLDATLATVARILKPGGYFFSSSICLTHLKGKLRMLAKGASAIPFLPTVGEFSEDELEERHMRAGLRIEERFSQAPGVAFWVAKKA